MKKFIRESKNKLLISEDNWKTINVLEKKSVEAEEERNHDRIKEVKIRHKLGDSKGKIIIEELNKIRKLISEEKNNGYGSSFEVFCISVLYDISYEEVYEKHIVKGNRDGKIDAIYWDDNNVYIYQIKLNFLEINYRNKIKKIYKQFIDGKEIVENDCEDLVNYLNVHKDVLKNKKCNIIMVSENDNGQNFTPYDVMEKFFEKSFLQNKNQIVLSLYIKSDEDINDGVSILLSKAKEEVYAFFYNAKEFIDTLLNVPQVRTSQNIYKYFYDNVRGFTGDNIQMISTIENEPENFSKYNNGITITGKVTYDNDGFGRIVIESPIISNGQQTIYNLLNHKDMLENINLLIIVKNDNEPSIMDKIARFTNTQKSISAIDLLSLDKNIREIQKNIYLHEKDDNEIFLDINTSGKKPYDGMIRQIYGKYGVISLKDFCKLYFSTRTGKLGSWKSTISTCINELLEEGIEEFDITEAVKVCKIIKTAKKYINEIEDQKAKNDLRSSDLALMYIMMKYNYSVEKAHEIIENINAEYYYNNHLRRSKLIDLYKSNNILSLIKSTIKSNVSKEAAEENEQRELVGC